MAAKTHRNRKATRKNKTHKKHSNGSFNANLNALLKELLQLQQQTKFFHWNTTMYSSHKVTDDFGEKLSGHIDTLVEIGIARKLKLSPVNKYFKNAQTITHKKAMLKRVDNIIRHIHALSKHHYAPNDIKAVLDTIMEDINVFKYLFVMH